MKTQADASPFKLHAAGISDMERFAVVHSFHSQVFRTIAEFGELQLVVCLDSHIDQHVANTSLIGPMNDRQKLAALRASAHVQIRRTVGELPPLALVTEGESPTAASTEIILVVPAVTIETTAATHQQRALRGDLTAFELQDPIKALEAVLDFSMPSKPSHQPCKAN